MANHVKMTKDGETIAVSPLVVADHKRLGWQEVGARREEAMPVAAKPKPKEEKPAGKPSLKDRRDTYAATLKAMTDEELVAFAGGRGVAAEDKNGRPRGRNQLVGELINIWNKENKE